MFLWWGNVLEGAEERSTSISQWGITWTFSEERTIGQYANGDWWVLGPVTITAISPESITVDGWTSNGTQVNPTASKSQGFDSSPQEFSAATGGAWDATLNRHPSFTGGPLALDAGSVVSSISRGRKAGRPQLDTVAILTVVQAIPAEDSFRPGPSEDGNIARASYWNAGDLNYEILQRLTPVAGMPTLAATANRFERPWVEFVSDNQARYLHALKNQPEYGRDIANTIGEGLMVLHGDYSNSEKRMLYIRMVQLGIDIYSACEAGVVWLDLGGINPGRKAPLVLAALALDDAGMAEYADASEHFIFQDDRQTWYVTEVDVGRTLYTADNRPREPYIEADVGLPEWGEQHTKQAVRDGRNWNAYYRDICNGSLVTHALAMQLTAGAVELWNWPAFFDYHDRAFELDKATAGGTNKMTLWEREAWLAYRTEASSGRWGGYSKDADGLVDTGEWLGWLSTERAPWIYSYSLDSWIYASEPGASDPGVWAYVGR